MTTYDGSDFDSQLDSLAEEASADDAYQRHPEGNWPAVINDIVSKTTNSGKPVWEFTLTTSEGEVQWTLWGFTTQDMATQESRDKVKKSIARYKAMFRDLGLQEPKTWSGGDNSILGRMGELLGRSCTAVVQKDRNDATKQRVFINAPKGAATRFPDTAGDGTRYAPPPDDAGSAFSNSPINTPGLDDIPF